MSDALLYEVFGDMIDPASYIGRIWEEPFDWQKEALKPEHKSLILNCARQSGKSTIVSGICLHNAKHKPKSLNLIISPSEKQSQETMKKVEDFMALDEGLMRLSRGGDSKVEKEFKNGSRIIALPGTEKSVRGYSKPTTIIIDEAARLADETYKALRPMLVGTDSAQLILLSTPWNKSGFFYNEWVKNPTWKKIYVVPRWELDDITGRIVERQPLEEFKEKWAKQGIDAFYSPRHTLDFLYGELMSIGEIWFKREYGCEFIEGMESMFSLDLIESAYDDSIGKKYNQEDYSGDEVKTYDFLGGLF